MSHSDNLPAVVLEPGDAEGMSAEFESEKRSFWAMRARLLEQHEGEYVAVFGGRVVDHDKDKVRLGLRVYKQFGYKPIYVQLVSRDGMPLKRIASPKRADM